MLYVNSAQTRIMVEEAMMTQLPQPEHQQHKHQYHAQMLKIVQLLSGCLSWESTSVWTSFASFSQQLILRMELLQPRKQVQSPLSLSLSIAPQIKTAWRRWELAR